MLADVQNLFIRIHMLHLAQTEDLTVSDVLTRLEALDYRVGEREVKQELERLTQENFLTSHNEQFSITGAGIDEFKEIQTVLNTVCSEVGETNKV
ncbi:MULTISPECIES: hypothetical protein [unclassified Paenibacillus]|uniref:Uncharacterized protein n=1 Tax=Paenibacillus provencensis TaxID=441151 RepID=A0ABW3PYU4_9BACL|nr:MULTISPECIES: hypothetical protein [unclassified Paenibacillus]MCM3129458.1 hypothetical protein [Paenibacillus sp. MER 78]SFS73458.1 hypothetical protein SAMN04488601_102315 [Paenibacillus sp. 453mf]